MDFTQYQQIFLDILDEKQTAAPYNEPGYLNYVKLNQTRQQRWLKTAVLDPDLVAAIRGIDRDQFWTVITEPWCGDAAHTVPFIHLLSTLNPLIKTDYQLRDSPPFLINNYLTNGTKSIPRLIIADKNHNNIAVWGPRPHGCQLLFEQLHKDHVDHDHEKIALQAWYNNDKGESFQKELLFIIKQYSTLNHAAIK